MIEFHRRARDELSEALEWYLDRSQDAAQRFLDEVDRVVERIKIDPKSYPTLDNRHHYVRVSRFPYCLVFEVPASDRVIIKAVAHTSRRVGYWRQRDS